MKIIGIGRLTKDVEIKQVGDSVVGNFSIAKNRLYKDKQTGQSISDFHNCFIWGDRANTFAQYVKKGQQVLIEGTLQNNIVVQQDGTNRVYTKIKVDNFEFISGQQQQQATTQFETKPATFDDAVDNVPNQNSDLPF